MRAPLGDQLGHVLALSALRDDQSFNAIEAYSGAIALRPDSMLAYLRRGQTYQRRGDRGDLERAARDFRTAARLDPTAPRPLEALGDVLFQSQQYARAAATYERFVRLDDRSARVDYKLALARYRDGDADGAIAALTDTLRLDDSLADAQYLVGVCLRFGDLGAGPADTTPEDAVSAIRKALTMDLAGYRYRWWLYHICSTDRYPLGHAAGRPLSFERGGG